MVQRRTQRLELGRQRFALLESALRGTGGLGMHGVGLLLQRLACIREGNDHGPFVFGATFPQEKALGHQLTYKWHQCAGVQCHLVGLTSRWPCGRNRAAMRRIPVAQPRPRSMIAYQANELELSIQS